MNGFLKISDNLAEFEEIKRGLINGQSPVSAVGVSDSVRTHLVFCLSKKLHKAPLIITANETQAKLIFEDINRLFGGKALLFPERDLLFYDIEASANDIKKNRLEVLDKLVEKKGEYAVVTTVSALLGPTVSKDVYKERAVTLKVGDEIELDELSKIMTDFGYQREEMVEGAGQFSVRGGIFDYFPFWSDMPFRIEFFDCMVDSVRRFFPETQRTVPETEEELCAKITPASEIVLNSEVRERLVKTLSKRKKAAEAKVDESESMQKLAKVLSRDLERIEAGVSFVSMDKYIGEIYADKIPTLLDYISEDYIVFMDDPARIQDAARGQNARYEETIKDLLERGILSGGKHKHSRAFSEVAKVLSEMSTVNLCPLSHSNGEIKPKKLVNITAKSLNSYGGKIEFFYDALDFYKKNKYRIVILAGSERRAQNLVLQLEEEGFAATLSHSFEELPSEGNIIVTKGDLSRGFEYPLIRTVVICDREIFGGEKKKRRRIRVDKKNKLDSFTELSVGDFVVHQNHGIGQYMGIQRLTVEGAQRDYLKIVYKGGDFLYVPADQLNLIYKHTSGNGAKVKLNNLGGQDWNRTKQRVKDSCADMAKELVELYAQREAIRGIEFSKDTEWQRDFEAAFPYDETEDQLRCIDEVKSDMEKPHPMERLLCGDVGYGKTEVAMRAAFKAVMDGYQVAYLVPTTILANQHYNNFRQRMKDYPVNISCLSRFSGASQQKNIVKQLKSGECDIVIGTHKILQKSVEFKKLGLLIIDEEQRFGVAHKERIKEIKKEIDVLTLSATPIPRTLHMSMTGIRDMSVIAEPPGDRFPVATYVMEYDEDVIREAINKEMARGGQIYYLHNRVQGIEKTALNLEKMVPDARVAVAHGKMSERELENIMMDMSSGEVDILVCTTIIETGLDIPNVNTIIIEDADRLGLAQLYQLRGRVGRSNRLAYAYLTYRADKVLNEDAQKRLRAIREFTEFGSGFKIAMRDLEIRGTGNVIGPQQSGHMESVGYEMYCRLLAESVGALKGLETKKETDTSIDLPLSAFIPESYIGNHGIRISIYKKIAAIETEDELSDVYDELIDRFGDIPDAVSNLMKLSLVRKIAASRKFTEVKGDKAHLILIFDPEDAPDLAGLVVGDDFMSGRVQLKNGKKPKIIYKIPPFKTSIEYLNIIKDFIEKI
ncbi:MAG: transcription-repair coupling factor [Clostridia bacterium]|nr:transcription-repair coupling factor [Clostridia bacterium]